MRQSWYAAGVALALLGPLLGCGKDEIRNYAAPKEGQAPAAQAPAPVPPPPGMETVEWTLPAGWQERPGEGMGFATAFTLAQGSGCPILPILVEGTANALPKRGFVLHGRHAIRIRVLDEIPHQKLRDRPVEDVTSEVWQIFALELGPERVAVAESARREAP